MRRRFVVAGIAIFPILARAEGWQTFPRSELELVTTKGRFKFKVEMATTPAQMAQGLMFRRSLDPDAGMLFDYGTTQRVSFWMKNTLIPLDMIFIYANGRVAAVHERAVPLSEQAIPSPVPVRAVLEVNGGTAARLGIKPGDLVVHPIFE
ncbi:MAG: DUF192 domain-containing protein [Rhodospirillales bacterium]|nr:DUF192 domain-containing protein [Rhodospirillales bacterium]